ncbi:tlde1 domain-containing protein [Siccibacter colletis]|uniref:tlde1 domain-containing protein n=1 Tax=Siccibacter colletis TaxID=1505757 RepID=UPI003CF0CA84
MALNGKLLLNGADYAPFNLYGVGVFMAFSGNGIYRNKGACGAMKGDGPLPPGKYWIVERGSAGCITIAHNSDYALIRNALMNTTPVQVPCMRSLMARGWVEVVASDYKNICP